VSTVNITLRVIGRINGLPVTLSNVPVTLGAHTKSSITNYSDESGSVAFTVEPDQYSVQISLLGNILPATTSIDVTPTVLDFTVYVSLTDWHLMVTSDLASVGEPIRPDTPLDYGRNLFLKVQGPYDLGSLNIMVTAGGVSLPIIASAPSVAAATAARERAFLFFTDSPGQLELRYGLGNQPPRLSFSDPPTVVPRVTNPQPVPIEGGIAVTNRRTASRMTEDVPLWISIRRGTNALGFDRYLDFMNWLFCPEDRSRHPGARTGAQVDMFDNLQKRRFLPFTDTDAYRSIKVATEAFVMANCGVFADFDSGDADYVQNQVVLPEKVSPSGLESRMHQYLQSVDAPGVTEVLPYLAIVRRKMLDQQIKDMDISDVFPRLTNSATGRCFGLLQSKLTCPCLLELIWSYWQEEGMLVQTMNALTRRFQNVRSPLANDPLANMEIDPLRPLNNLIWGFIQDEQHRLSVVRRNYEYDHHYGLRLAGRAVRAPRTADSRSKFLEAFHTMLSLAAAFYKRDDDTTIVADGFPVLNALKEAHLILSQGAHNQFGDLPSTARIEMLMQQWILARPEFREFLPTRIMVAYPEPWMDRVDAMKKLQGWSDTSVLHFRNLAIFGEQVLLSIRYGVWAGVIDPFQAVNWARYWRPEIQGYLHAYRSVTGVDLSVDVTNARVDATLPSVHLVHRLTDQRRVLV
jgi:hypothetical protein